MLSPVCLYVCFLKVQMCRNALRGMIGSCTIGYGTTSLSKLFICDELQFINLSFSVYIFCETKQESFSPYCVLYIAAVPLLLYQWGILQ